MGRGGRAADRRPSHEVARVSEVVGLAHEVHGPAGDRGVVAARRGLVRGSGLVGGAGGFNRRLRGVAGTVSVQIGTF